MEIINSGIQQIGLGVTDVYAAWNWYKKHLGFDIKMFDEAAEANLMLPYTNNQPQKRHAILAINLKGGGGFELWEYKSRKPVAASFDLSLGDLGIFSAKIKTEDINKAYQKLSNNEIEMLSKIVKNPAGYEHFYIKDPWGNILDIEGSSEWNLEMKKLIGGNSGALIGVSNMDKSIDFYSHILGYDEKVFDEKAVFPDYSALTGGKQKLRRVLLKHNKERMGAFGKLFGPSTIELVSLTESKGRKIYENRLWGDLGYIHLCYDITGMKELKEECEKIGHPFTVDSANSFDMGNAAGHFAYIEDPDGTLIEFVETHKIPIMKKLGWYLDLRKRDQKKHLPPWFYRAINLTRSK
jgi:catechol 2,3-dioxygenase-like lactoylglutathione lyase family enzyme